MFALLLDTIFITVTFQRGEVRQTYGELSSLLLRYSGQNVQTTAT